MDTLISGHIQNMHEVCKNSLPDPKLEFMEEVRYKKQEKVEAEGA